MSLKRKPRTPKIVCYCNRITDEEICNTVKETGLKTIDEVKSHLRTNPTSDCAKLNPTGKCCHEDFEKTIKKALKQHARE